MGSRAVRKEAEADSRRGRAPLRGLGFLTLALGFLTLPSFSAPLDEALARLGRLESERAGILARADSLGLLLGTENGMSDPRARAWLESAEALAARSQEMELEILLERERCRSLARQELAALSPRDGTAPARELELRDLLEGRLSGGFGGAWVVVEPDSIDGTETLLDKQAYLRDLRDLLEGVRERADRREERIRREQALFRAGEGLLDEARFLDEGGRVGSDETVLLHGMPGSPPGGDAARVPGTTGGIDGVEFPDRLGGGDPGRIDAAAALREIRRQVDLDLERIDASLEQIERLLRRASPGGS